jgi:hypothetical protein
MDNHCGCVISYMHKYEMKLYIHSQFLFPLTLEYQGPKTKPCKVSDMTLTKFVRCPGPCPRESYGVCPRAQAHIPCLGTPGQRIFYSNPQAQAHSFRGIFGISYLPPSIEEKSVIKMIWLLIPVYDWRIIMIGPAALLLVPSLPLICTPSFRLMGGFGKGSIPKLG